MVRPGYQYSEHSLVEKLGAPVKPNSPDENAAVSRLIAAHSPHRRTRELLTAMIFPAFIEVDSLLEAA